MEIVTGKCKYSPSGYHQFFDDGTGVPLEICVHCGYVRQFDDIDIKTSSINITITINIDIVDDDKASV